MPVKVIDASALAAVLFGEAGAEEVASRIRGHSLVSPALLAFEVASVCLKKIRRHPAQRSSLLAACGLLRRMEIAETEVDVSEVVVLAEERKLTVYDAAYLWLAQKLKAELVTLDKTLAAEASKTR
jgi:predicted nucleic acid-binding protein